MGILCIVGLFSIIYTFFAIFEPYSFTISRTDDSAFVVHNSQVTSHHSDPGIPERLIIPRIEVDAAVQAVGLVAGAMGVPTNFSDVAWYKLGVRPGMPGSAVIDGHRSGKWIPHGVFFSLKYLVVGDLVLSVDDHGATSTFVVTAVTAYPYDAPTGDVFSSSDQAAHLNLITCSGLWNSGIARFTERTIIFTTLLK